MLVIKCICSFLELNAACDYPAFGSPDFERKRKSDEC